MQPPVSSKQGAFRRLVNLGMLIGGFGIGQGSIFLAQTYLVATGRTQLLALFGTHFSVAMLGIIAVEAGSLTILSAQIARLLVSGDSRDKLWQSYWETTAYRVTVALLLVIGLLIFRSLVPLPDFSEYYLLGALPALLIWSLNGAGFLDGLQKSGISGLTGSIAYVASAVGLVMAVDASDTEAGLLTGAALSVGYGLTVIIQFGALSILGWRPRYATPTAVGIRKAFVEESSMLAGLLPGQLYFRVQLAIAAAFLGSNGHRYVGLRQTDHRCRQPGRGLCPPDRISAHGAGGSRQSRHFANAADLDPEDQFCCCGRGSGRDRCSQPGDYFDFERLCRAGLGVPGALLGDDPD
jgi:hypothetical protein